MHSQLHPSAQSNSDSLKEEKELARRKTAAQIERNKAAALQILKGAQQSLERNTPKSPSLVKKTIWI